MHQKCHRRVQDVAIPNLWLLPMKGGIGWRSSGEYEDALVLSMAPIHDALLRERFGRMVQEIEITQLKTVSLKGTGAESFIKRNACANFDI